MSKTPKRSKNAASKSKTRKSRNGYNSNSNSNTSFNGTLKKRRKVKKSKPAKNATRRMSRDPKFNKNKYNMTQKFKPFTGKNHPPSPPALNFSENTLVPLNEYNEPYYVPANYDGIRVLGRKGDDTIVAISNRDSRFSRADPQEVFGTYHGYPTAESKVLSMKQYKKAMRANEKAQREFYKKHGLVKKRTGHFISKNAPKMTKKPAIAHKSRHQIQHAVKNTAANHDYVPFASVSYANREGKLFRPNHNMSNSNNNNDVQPPTPPESSHIELAEPTIHDFLDEETILRLTRLNEAANENNHRRDLPQVSAQQRNDEFRNMYGNYSNHNFSNNNEINMPYPGNDNDF